MTGIADRSLRDLVPVFDRYRPVALAATAVLIAVAVVPGAARSGPAAFDSASSFEEFSSDESGDFDGSGGDVAAPSTTPTQSDADSAFDTGGVPAASGPSFSAPSGRDRASAPSGSASTPSAGGDPSPAPSFDRDFGDSLGDDEEGADEPLQIVVSAFASSTAGTPLPDDVPDGSVPVGTRVGQADKASYIRLSGTGTSLVLTEIADGRRGGEFETPPVQACQITESGWEASEDMGFADAPAHDPERCVDLLQQADGTWQLSLITFDDPTDDRGLALVPAAEPPLDFQVAFSTQVQS